MSMLASAKQDILASSNARNLVKLLKKLSTSTERFHFIAGDSRPHKMIKVLPYDIHNDRIIIIISADICDYLNDATFDAFSSAFESGIMKELRQRTKESENEGSCDAFKKTTGSHVYTN